MNSLESTRLAVVMQEEDKDKATRISFGNIIDDPAEEKILALGDLVTALAPEETQLDSIVKTEQTRYFK